MRPFNMNEEEEQLNQIPAAPPIVPQNVPPVPQNVPRALPGMPPSVTPDELETYLGRNKRSLDTYGPEAQMNLQDQTMKERNSFRNKLTSGAKGLGDALMMGVAGAGNPGWQQSFENQQDQRAKERMDTLQSADTGNLRRTSTNMNIDRMSPNSQLSKTAQESYAPLFERLGYSPEHLKNMSAASIDSALQLMTAYGGKEMEANIKGFEREIEQMRLGAMLNKNASDERLSKEKMQIDEKEARQKDQMDAAEKLANIKEPGLISKLNPFSSGIPKEAEEAKKFLAEKMRGSDADFDAYYQSLPSGTPYVGPDGKQRIKK